MYTDNYPTLLPATTFDRNPSRRTCGIELEFLVPPVDSWPIERYGQLKPDGSVYPASSSSDVACELASHPTSGDRLLAQIDKLCALLSEHGAYTNNSCGLHVHLSVADLTPVQRRRILSWWQRFEEILFLFVKSRRRSSEFCQPVAGRDAFEEGGRYWALNINAYESHSTFECRIHHGTINPAEIKGWCMFLLSFFDNFSAISLTENRLAQLDDMTNRERLIFLFQQTHLPLSLRKHLVARLRTYSRAHIPDFAHRTHLAAAA